MISWFYLKNGKVTGPVKIEDIHRLVELKKIGGFDLIYRSDEKKWKPVVEFDEMQSLFTSTDEEELVNPDDEVTGTFDLSKLKVSDKEKETQWVVLKILDREVRPVKTEQLGPFSTSLVQKMIRSGDLSFQDYVWTDGMDQWGLLVEQEQLVPKLDLPDLVESLTIEDRVKEPEETSEELLSSVEVVQTGVIEEEEPPEEARVDDEHVYEDTETVPIIRASEVSLVMEEAKDVSEEKTVLSAPANAIENLEETLQVEELDPIIEKEKQKQKEEKSKNKKAKESEESDWTFRLLQGLFGGVIIGGIVGIAFYISHGSDTERESFFEKPKPEVAQNPPKVEERKVTPPNQNQPPPAAVPTPAPKVVEKAPEPPKPVVKKAPSYVKFNLKDVNGRRPKVLVETDGSFHYSADLLLTSAAGQSLGNPSYHREWTIKNFYEKYRTIDFRSLGLGDGWYTLVVTVDGKKALKTFFAGEKKGFSSRIRSYRAKLGYKHQKEKEQLYFTLKDLMDQLAVLKKNQLVRSMNPRDFDQKITGTRSQIRSSLRSISAKMKRKNRNLWTIYWLEIDDEIRKTSEVVENFAKAGKVDRRQLSSPLMRLDKLLGKVQGLRVVN